MAVSGFALGVGGSEELRCLRGEIDVVVGRRRCNSGGRLTLFASASGPPLAFGGINDEPPPSRAGYLRLLRLGAHDLALHHHLLTFDLVIMDSRVPVSAPPTIGSRLHAALRFGSTGTVELWQDFEDMEVKANKVDDLTKTVAELQEQLTSSNLQIQELQAKVEALEQAAVDKDSKAAQQGAIAAKMQQVLQLRQQPQHHPHQRSDEEEDAMLPRGAPSAEQRINLEEASHDYDGLGDYVL